MKKIIAIIFLSILSLSAYSQSNPFDISNTSSIAIDSVGNPFDIQEQNIEASEINNMPNNPFEIKAPVVINPEVTTIKKEQKNIYVEHFSNWLKKPMLSIPKLGLIIMLLASVLLAFVLNIDRSSLTKVIRSCSNTNIMRVQFRNSNLDGTQYLSLLSAIYLLSLSVYGYQWQKYFYGLSDIKIFILILLSISLIYFGKRLLSKIVGYIYNTERMADEYNFSFSNFCALLGVVLLPVNILAEVLDGEPLFWALTIGLIISAIIITLGYIQAFIIVVRIHTNSVFHFFLYLCTFEILPIAILVKLMTNLLG